MPNTQYLVSDLIQDAALLGEIIESRDEAITDAHQLSSRGLRELNLLLRLSYKNGIVPSIALFQLYESIGSEAMESLAPQYDAFHEDAGIFPETYMEYLRYGLANRLCVLDATELTPSKKQVLINARSNVISTSMALSTIS